MFVPQRSESVSFRDAWNRFFFAETRADALALVRISLCAAVLIPVISRWPHARAVYSSDGVVMPLWQCYPETIDLPVLSGNVAVAVYTGLIFCLFAGMIGWKTRFSLMTAAVLLIYFGLMDYAGTLTKYTVIAMHGLFILACAPSGAAWSVDAAARGDFSSSHVRIAAWPVRVLQLFLAILYFATAVTKVRTPEYMTGEHTLFWMQTNMNFAHPLGYWLSTHPALLVVSSYVVVIWETIFPVLCWNRITLKPLLLLGVVFHLMTYLLLGLAIFPLVMLALYPAFLRPDQARAFVFEARERAALLAGRWRIGIDRAALRWTQLVWVFPLAMALTIVTAVEAEYHIDPMGSRKPKPALPTIPAEAAVAVLQDTGPSRPGDYVHRVDLGSMSFAGVVCGQNTHFTADDSPELQVWAVAPHPDLYLHVDLVNEAEHTLLQDGLVIPRGELRSGMPFALGGNLTPGRYAFVVRDEVGVIARRPFELIP